MDAEIQFGLQIVGCFVAAIVVFYFMQRYEKKQQAARDQQFEITMAAIEARNKIHKMYQKD